MFKPHKKATADINATATEILVKLATGDVTPRKTNNRKYMVLNVAHRWRLIQDRRVKNAQWELIHHAEYDKKIDR